MKRATTALLVVTALVALALEPSAAKKRKAAPCPAGRFLLPGGAPLIAGDAAPGLDAVVLDDARTLSIASGCPSVRAKVKARRGRTRVGATWKRGACRDLRGKARLTARFDATCTTLTGKLKAKKFTRKFTARRSACGDGVLDAAGGEKCPGLEAAPGLAAVDVIADVDLDTGVTDAEVSVLPNGVRLARTRLEIELADGVTVAQVNALLAGVGAEILLTLAGQPFLLVGIPDPGTVEALDAVVATLAADPAVVSVSKGYFAGLAEIPANYDAGSELSVRAINHHVPVRAPAAWNARAALAAPSGRPTLIIQDTFGDGVPANDFALTGLVAEDFAAGAPAQHGYHVLGIAAATFGSPRPCPSVFAERACVTGMMPDSVAARAVDLREGTLVALAEGGDTEKVRTLRDTANARMLKLMRDTPGPLVVNTSLHDCATGICGDPARAAQEARKWSRRVRLYRLADRLLHVTASGNVGEVGSPDGADASTASGWAAAGLLPGLGADSLADSVLVVDNAFGFGTVPTRAECLHPTSKWGGHVAAMGTAVVSLTGAKRGANILTGTSMATPQVAGLALYLWSLDPTMTVGNVRDTIARTATPLAASSAPACSTHPAAPVIDAYGAVLALDGAAPPSPASAPVRNAILDVAGGDRRFDGADLEQYLKAYVQGFVGAANHGAPVAPAVRDWSRYDLNGDGFTGGAGTAAFDLDRVGSTRYGAPSLTTVAKSIAGSQVQFDETALTDMQILCYYAYSDLYQGTPAERTALLDPALCGVSVPAFDYTKINGGFFEFCVARLHVTITEPDGTMTNQVDEGTLCYGDQIPNFNLDLLPDAADVPGNLCLGARAPASDAHFDVATQSLVGRRTERTAATDTLFDSEWHAPIDTGANRMDEIEIDSCRSSGVFPKERRHFVLRNLTGQISPGLFAVELTGQAACDVLTSGEFSIEGYEGDLSDPTTNAFTSPECNADPATNYFILRLFAD